METGEPADSHYKRRQIQRPEQTGKKGWGGPEPANCRLRYCEFVVCGGCLGRQQSRGYQITVTIAQPEGWQYSVVDHGSHTLINSAGAYCSGMDPTEGH